MPEQFTPSPSSKPWILVLDSSESIRDACRRASVLRGLDCVIAANVPDALAMVYAQKPVAILVNIAAPVMPGTALIAALQASCAFRAIPIGALISSECSKEKLEANSSVVFLDRKEEFDASINEFFETIDLEPGDDKADDSSGLGRAPRVLLAEDSPTNQLILARMLHIAGADVTVVENGEEALDAIKSVAYDLVMMDIEMPKMDGIQATAEMRSLGVKVPIIAVTGHEEGGIACDDFQRNIDAFLEKPITKNDLLQTFQNYIGKTHGEAA